MWIRILNIFLRTKPNISGVGGTAVKNNRWDSDVLNISFLPLHKIPSDPQKENSCKGIMCIAAWVWQAHPVYQLLLLLNRDEYHDRPTEPVGWWGLSDKQILGGRDVVGGGTWLGCTKNGRMAFLTNVREPDSDHLADPKTRGALPVRFLESVKSPAEFAEEIEKEADQYNGFNLILSDLCSKAMMYISNRPKGAISIQMVSPGLHVLSNAMLDTPWYKTQLLGENFKELLEKQGDTEFVAQERVQELMTDTRKADFDKLPNTGVPPEWEHALSSIFVEVDTKEGRYGTRSMAALSVKNDGEVNFFERYLESGIWKEHTLQYHIKNVSNV
ncbi:transport and Golgi organization 2-like protein [Iris pallida]|uniref:Transport and Golgi organization 2-like protein n=1 Tax=Iris pallida TaxID=29817 RepID=A0AAX6GNJ6_IRIPA|nr:transport and Golgi organization 2-like protein [Iris pallida]